eukprot:CAMPEP_0195149438 /NCGR_PEP_ID=MMETSP0448-20130528/177067_1 /TAXON_ID=66468 /ORGANISM="Heterocapsa triquestra, Strain CCMP 448" /LENGTH=66 /DNA_ID=CAMNT_0040188089 /DNA_START=27 /DNA_END=223 /DNA_ORIENTATION=+
MAGVRRFEEQDADVDSLLVVRNFPPILGVFCALRLVRPLLLWASFPGGPQTRDAAAGAARTLQDLA